MKEERGSITLFSAISLLLITSIIFTLLEGTRIQELRRFADLQTQVALESVFAKYNSFLWEKYHLLGVDFSIVDDTLYKISNARAAGKSMNLLQLETQEIVLEGYTRITDANGYVFINCVSGYMKDNLIYESAKEIYNRYEAVKEILNSNGMDRDTIGEAIYGIENAEIKETNSTGTTEVNDVARKDLAISILEIAKQWQETEILELVIENSEDISEAELDDSDSVLGRNLNKGKNSVVEEINWEDRILLQQYLLTYMSNYRDVKAERALQYELEYIIGEKLSDRENLISVVMKLVTVREAANFMHLITNSAKVARAEGLATLVVGASLNPILIEIVKMGLLTAWALAESILDVRALLAGKKVAFMKSEESWTTELENLEEISRDFAMAKESVWGLSYEDYLGILLFFEGEENLAMRCLQMQEVNIRKSSENSSFCIDTLITQASVNIRYSYESVFPFLEFVDMQRRWKNSISTEKAYGYY